ncbi:MAG: hypothetical protein FWF59_09255 [Turicibacter sp.]|nr:hypothetical protein [Turicibacter sp.]
MGFLANISKHYETKDGAQDPALATRYYRNNYKVAKEAVMQVAKGLGFAIRHEDDERKEHLLEGKDGEIIISMINITPIETTIDFTVNTTGALSFGKGKKIIAALYNELDKQLMTIKK